MVVKRFQDSVRPLFLKIDISQYLTEKSSDFHEIWYTAADFELDKDSWIFIAMSQTIGDSGITHARQ